MWRECEAALPDGPEGLGRLTPACRTTKNGRMAKLSSKAVERRGGPVLSGVGLWDFMAITKALADEQRIRMLLALQGRELCLCQLVELVGLAASTVSKHMSILRQSRLVEGRKQGRWMYYRLAGRRASSAVRQGIEWVRRSLADDPGVAQDAERLKAILSIDTQRLCARQSPPKRRPGKNLPSLVTSSPSASPE
jgi:ArsR family transcriptional regulator, arsenate/arsenite/antimonite-responsive transcriptional repressor